MLFHVLGPVEFHGRDGDVVAIGAEKPRTLLSLLALHANSWVDTEQIANALWGDSPSGTARNNIKTYVWKLRRQLPPSSDGRPRIESRAGGYRLNVDRDDLDTSVFEYAVAIGRKHLSAGNPVSALDMLTEALRLWRGDPFHGLATPDIGAERARLVEVRWQAREGLADAMLALGQTNDAIGLLRSLVGACPLRERIWYRLIVALHLGDRRADALDAYQHARRTLIEELGVEPGPELQKIHKRILREEAEESAKSQAAIALPGQVTRNYLPPDLPDFVGRTDELCRLRSLVGPAAERAAARLVVIDGAPGVGKSAFALHAAHLLSADYPDAQLYVDLRGHDEDRAPVNPAEALRTLLGAIGAAGSTGEVADAPIEVLAAQWRAWLAGQRAVVVLDDVADVEQLRPLLLAGPGCLVLATSRRRLLGPDGAQALHLDVLPPADSVELLARAVGDRRADDEPEAAATLAELCGHQPLALRIAATRLAHRPTWTVHRLAARLEHDGDGLDELNAGGRGVATAIDLSYVELTAEQQRAYRLLATAPTVDVDATATAALVDRELPVVEDILDKLAGANLLRQVAPGRYRLPEPHRRHGHGVALAVESNRDRRAALTRLLDFYLYHATVVAARLRAGDDTMRDWLALERANLIIAVRWADANGMGGHARRLRLVLPDLVPPKRSAGAAAVTPLTRTLSFVRRPAVAAAALAIIAGIGPVLAAPDGDPAAYSGALPSTGSAPAHPDAVLGGDRGTSPTPPTPPTPTAPPTGQTAAPGNGPTVVDRPGGTAPARPAKPRPRRKPAAAPAAPPPARPAPPSAAPPARSLVPPAPARPAPNQRPPTMEQLAAQFMYDVVRDYGGPEAIAMLQRAGWPRP